MFQSNYGKNMRWTQIERQSTKYLTSTPQNSQDHKKQGNTENLSRPGGTQGDEITKVSCAILHGLLEKKTGWDLNKIWSLMGSNILLLISYFCLSFNIIYHDVRGNWWGVDRNSLYYLCYSVINFNLTPNLKKLNNKISHAPARWLSWLEYVPYATSLWVWFPIRAHA